jgi:multicomponent Na+:H+ antiporter subunit D
LLAVVYVWRIVEVAYFQKSEDTAEVKEAPFLMQLSMWLLVGATLFFGVFTSLTVGVARRAAEWLMGGGA